jgi:hypothetical protein
VSGSHWRKRAREVIDRTILENAGKEPAELLKLIDQAYPFGPRQYHPYKCWLLERAAVRVRLFPPNPGALARTCPACGVGPDRQCIDYQNRGDNYTFGPPMEGFHASRETPGSGPLFTPTPSGNQGGGEP